MVSMLQAVTYFEAAPEFSRLSVSTKRRWKINLARLFREIQPGASVKSLKRWHIDGALNQAQQNTPNLSDGSMNAYKTDFRRFGKFLVVSELVSTNPAAHLVNQKRETPKSKRKPITLDQATRLIELAGNMHPRDGMTMILMLNTGLREVEVKGLRWRNIDLEENEAAVKRTKIKDELTIFYTPRLAEALPAWRQYYIDHHGPINPDWYVVPARASIHEGAGRQRQKMNPDWPLNPSMPQWNIAKRVKQLLEEVGEVDLWGRASHTLRRTAGNLLKQSGADIRVVKDFYGHASVAQTEAYLDIDELRDTRKKFIFGGGFNV